MVDTAKLRGIIAENGKTQSDIAKMLDITPKTFYSRMQKGVFGSDEIQIMIEELNIADPINIFFAKSNLMGYKRDDTQMNKTKQ